MYISVYWNCFSLSGKHILVDVLIACVQLQPILCIAVVFDVSSFFLFYFFSFFIYTKVRAAFNKTQLHMNWSCFLLNAAHSQLELRLINAAPISSAFFFFLLYTPKPWQVILSNAASALVELRLCKMQLKHDFQAAFLSNAAPKRSSMLRFL